MTQTTIESGLLIRPVARFVAIGLFLMAFFTTLWALWALYGLPTVAAVVLVAIFVALSVVFVINGVQLIKSASRLPIPSGEESQRQGRAMQLGFGINFAAEGVIIAVVCALLGMSGADAYSDQRSRWWSGCISYRLASSSTGPSTSILRAGL
jgi:hypothetical protein